MRIRIGTNYGGLDWNHPRWHIKNLSREIRRRCLGLKWPNLALQMRICEWMLILLLVTFHDFMALPTFRRFKAIILRFCGLMVQYGVRYLSLNFHDDVIKWKHFPRYWPFVRWIHRSPVNSPHKGQWREALMFSLICAWMNGWVNNREAGDLRRRRAHYDVNGMLWWIIGNTVPSPN